MRVALMMNKILKSALPLCGGLILLVLLGYWLPRRMIRAFVEMDMLAYYQAAAAVLHHHSPYNAPVNGYDPSLYPVWYFYSPQFAAIISPVARLSFREYIAVLMPFLVASLLGYAYVLASIMRPRADWKARLRDSLSWLCIVLMSPNQFANIAIGNVDIFVCFLTGLAFLSNRRPLLFALVMQIKPFAALPLALSWWRERFSLIPPILCLTVGCLIGGIVCGFDSFLEWRRTVADVLGQGSFNHWNFSLSVLVLRILRWAGIWHYSHGPLNAGPRLFLLSMSIAGPLAAAYAFRRLPNLKYYAVLLLTCVLFSPICWSNYLSIGFILVALLIRDRLESPAPDIPSMSNAPATA